MMKEKTTITDFENVYKMCRVTAFLFEQYNLLRYNVRKE